MTHKDIIEQTLKNTKKLMTPGEIVTWAKENIPGVAEKYNSAQTPEKTISAQMYIDMKRSGDESTFIKADDSMLFGLRDLKDSYGELLTQESNGRMIHDVVTEKDKEKEKQREKQMHKPLATYLLNDPFFMLHVKTIEAGNSKKKKKGESEWEHPDIIGVRYASEMYENAFETMQKNAETLFELFSFELKLSLHMYDVCEKYFQAVSNSSWANYGYLVVNEIDEDNNELMEKLTVLNDQFGIGLIKLEIDLNDIDSSLDTLLDNTKIIFKSKRREINYRFLDRFMSRDNSDITDFFNSVNGQAESKLDVNPSFYDDVYDV